MSNKHSVTSKCKNLEASEDHQKEPANVSNYRVKLAGFYKDEEIDILENWLENEIRVDDALHTGKIF